MARGHPPHPPPLHVTRWVRDGRWTTGDGRWGNGRRAIGAAAIGTAVAAATSRGKRVVPTPLRRAAPPPRGDRSAAVGAPWGTWYCMVDHAPARVEAPPHSGMGAARTARPYLCPVSPLRHPLPRRPRRLPPPPPRGGRRTGVWGPRDTRVARHHGRPGGAVRGKKTTGGAGGERGSGWGRPVAVAGRGWPPGPGGTPPLPSNSVDNGGRGARRAHRRQDRHGGDVHGAPPASSAPPTMDTAPARRTPAERALPAGSRPPH